MEDGIKIVDKRKKVKWIIFYDDGRKLEVPDEGLTVENWEHITAIQTDKLMTPDEFKRKYRLLIP